MATTFNVIYLGNFPSIDPIEGNNTAENALDLVGSSFGNSGDALARHIHEFSMGSTGFTGGTSNAYDMDNNQISETFTIDGGAEQTFDSSVIYDATVTFLDGSTATVSAVLFQDTAGNTYLAPEFSNNADQAVYDSGGILSLRLDGLEGDTYSGMTGEREVGFVPCFTAGTCIRTPSGDIAIERLNVGDLVSTRDHGAQPILWIGRRRCRAKGALAPISIRPGALGQALPKRALCVSPQHRMLLKSKIAERMFGTGEVLVAAHKLTDLPGIDVNEDSGTVEYIHILLKRHEILSAEGAETESLYLGNMVKTALCDQARREIAAIFPDLANHIPCPARQIPEPRRARRLISRHLHNDQPLLALGCSE